MEMNIFVLKFHLHYSVVVHCMGDHVNLLSYKLKKKFKSELIEKPGIRSGLNHDP